MKSAIARLVLVSLISSYAVVSKAQVAYYDALLLRNSLENGKLTTSDSVKMKYYTGLLLHYLPDSCIGKSPDEILRNLSQVHSPLYNPFISKLIEAGSGLQSAGSQSGSQLSASTQTPSLGNLDVTTFADGLAKFLVKRSEEELATMFFRDLQIYLRNHQEIGTLFPNTLALLGSFDYWDYSNFINTIREAFDKDIKQLPRDIVKLKDVDKMPESFKRFLHSDTGRILLSCLELGDDLVSGRKLPDAIDQIASDKLLGGAGDVNLKNTIKLINILSYSLRSNDLMKQYISLSELKALYRDSVATQLYCGLIWQQIHTSSLVIAGIRVDTVVTPPNVQKVRNYIETVVAYSQQLNDGLQKISDATLNSDQNKWVHYASIFQSVGKLIRGWCNLSSLNDRMVPPPQTDLLIEYSNSALTIAQDISVRNYHAVVIDIMKLFGDIYEGNPPGEFMMFMHDFTKYASFAANVAGAKNSDDIENAIQAIALPSGSSQIKRESRFNADLNGYVGLYGGWDQLSAIPNSGALSYGITAPLGLGFSWGHRFLFWGTRNPWSTSLFFSVIDLGAITSFRAHNDSISQIPTVQLKDIVSLGAFVSLGIPYAPVSINIGVQGGPNLHSVNSTYNDYRNASSVRYSVSICIDIPLFNFYTKPPR
jgi:hypothetical protein